MVEKILAVEAFWREFCAAAGIDDAVSYQVWFFGNGPDIARELAELVIAGRKRATASLVEYNERHPETAPVAGGYSVVTDFEGVPLCVLRTTEIRLRPFDEVDEAFAFDEGEGDRTLSDWRDGHRRYFTREAAEFGFEFHEKSLVACERFELLFPVGEKV
ncbi:MAG: ASCH domain-containing protein [Acidobacteria bacterium]|nr:ASCH domain-containing protein [Acidobacteriota bacterium]